ncbi:uncharacterized protein N7500_004227 [Penicillium coprophilum]|uniref:uncharacterized protein n=1 Tax=Penicillium coprophilum TaxID=36646 RepID=UPI0023901FDC|nr:uncharacterized protein N7500_004227 [Penicillium coprophilum]KAJ5171444.1 hypothetical protein N7500_004227 [Penicillium coprophilum]
MEERPFLPTRSNSLSVDEESEFAEKHIRSPKRSPYEQCLPWLIQLFVFTVYTTIFFLFWDRSQSRCSEADASKFAPAYSPASKALKWELRTFQNQLEITNPFKGPPRPELEEAWNKLLHPSAAILVDKESLDRINRTSVELRDGSGYMAALDVYHQLHCLRWVRRYIHQDHYNSTEENLGQHIDHCLDGLRQYVMCNADLSINTFDWIPNYPKPWPNFEVVHKCANWESIEEWVLANSFDGFDPDLIRHPDYHPELPSPFNYTVSGNSP